MWVTLSIIQDNHIKVEETEWKYLEESTLLPR